MMVVNNQLFSKQMNQIKTNINQAKPKGTKELARIHRRVSRRHAPVFTGETKQGIKLVKIKKGHRVLSSVSSDFPQNLFANRTSPFATLRFKAKGGSVFYGPNQTVAYGKTAYSRKGNPINWTGTPGFFNLGRTAAMKKAEGVMISKVKKALA